MSLKFNNTEVTQVYFNGVEQMTLKYNGTSYFGKRFRLTKNASTGVTLTVNRTSSPNQHAATGSVATGNTIYYGDVITISVAANTNYANPVLYVNTGSGLIQRTSPYTFTVNGDVTFYGSATASDSWQTVWSGSQTYSESGSFTVPGLASGGTVQITANISFGEWYIHIEDGSVVDEQFFTGGVNRAQVPCTAYGLSSSVSFSRNGDQIVFEFHESEEYNKGYVVYEAPVSLTITEIRRKS